jgi:hypothetical protein
VSACVCVSVVCVYVRRDGEDEYVLSTQSSPWGTLSCYHRDLAQSLVSCERVDTERSNVLCVPDLTPIDHSTLTWCFPHLEQP